MLSEVFPGRVSFSEDEVKVQLRHGVSQCWQQIPSTMNCTTPGKEIFLVEKY